MLDNLLHSPTLLESHCDSSMRHSDSSTPFPKPTSYAVMCQQPGFAGILSLFHRGCPFAVRRPAICEAFRTVSARIVPVVIYSLDGCLWKRLRSHVSHKADERAPSLAEGYPTPAVSVVTAVAAAMFHVLPRLVFWGLVPLASRAARSRAITTTGHLVAPTKDRPADNDGLAALTATYPVQLPPIAHRTEFHDCQLSIDAPNFIGGIYASARICYSGAKISAEQHRLGATLALTVPLCAAFASSATDNSPLSIDIPSLVFHSWVDPQWAAKSAAFATARCKVVPSDKVSHAAVAQDAPVGDLTPLLSEACYHKTAESLPSEIFEIVGASDRITRRHDSTPIKLDYCESQSGPQDLFGSFHYSSYGRQVQHVA